MAHRNSHTNQEAHHLYEIIDKLDNDVFKYGISSDPIEADGLSKRLRKQLAFLNLIDEWERFFGRILQQGINGRQIAERIENEYISNYEIKNSRRPRGNLK
jgi:URI fold toxin 2